MASKFKNLHTKLGNQTSHKWGETLRLSVVSIWAIYVILTNIYTSQQWLPLLFYVGFAALIFGVKIIFAKNMVIPCLTVVIDVAFISYLVHVFGSHTSQLAVYYVLMLLGYHMQENRFVRRSALLFSLLGYGIVLVLERFEIIPYIIEVNQIAELPPLEQTISAFFKIAVALLAEYAFLSITVKQIEHHVLSEKKALEKVQIAQEKSRELQKQIEASQRLESLGRLAGGVAHDFNNLLTGILSYTNFLKEDLIEETESHKDLEVIIDATRKASRLTAQLLTFGRKQIIRPQTIYLNKVVTETKDIFRRSISENIKIVTSLNPDLGNIKADHSQIEQVLVNLVVNAQDAMKAGGTLTIETCNIEITPENFSQYPELSLGPHVKLSVTDTGIGIPHEHIGKIFDPFFTTKRKEQGTGLGLSTVYGIIRQNNGHIDVQSQVHVGTTFCIAFPRDYETVTTSTAPQPIIPGDKEIILVAEDENMVRSSVVRILKRQNYDVIAAQNGEEALEMYHGSEMRIDLLLTDVIMTGITGEALADQLKALRPELPVLFMSGYTEDAIVNKGFLKEGTAFIAKPFSSDELLVAVAKTLRRAKKRALEKSQRVE